MLTLFTITVRFLTATDVDKTLQRPCGDCTKIAQSMYTTAQKSHDAHAMYLGKSHGVCTLTVQSSSDYVQSCINRKTITFVLCCRLRWRLKQKAGKESFPKRPELYNDRFLLLCLNCICNCATLSLSAGK